MNNDSLDGGNKTVLQVKLSNSRVLDSDNEHAQKRGEGRNSGSVAINRIKNERQGGRLCHYQEDQRKETGRLPVPTGGWDEGGERNMFAAKTAPK